MSDEEDFFSASDEEADFSVSEDEWLPESKKSQGNKKKMNDTTMEDSDFDDSEDEDDEIDDEIDDEDSDISEEEDESTPRSTKSSGRARGSRIQTTLQTQPTRKLFSKYTVSNRPTISQASISTSLSDILKRSEFRTRKFNSSQEITEQSSPPTTSNSDKNSKEIKKTNDDNESSSSGDEYLVDPKKLDLGSSFFSTTKNNTEVPKFDCNVGVQLSEESDSDDEGDVAGFGDDNWKNVSLAQPSTIDEQLDQTNKSSTKAIDLQEFCKFNQELEDVKKQMQTYHSKKNNVQEDVNVSQLLAIGEENVVKEKNVLPQKESSSQRSRGTKRKNAESESDWEVVSEDEVEPTANSSNNLNDIQITVELPGGHRRRTTKEIDVEACLKRKLNRIKKENQVYIHKAHVLGWIAHGNRVNQKLNNPTLYKYSLKTLPSPAKQVYPKDKTDIKYYEQITTWFRQAYDLKSNSVYPEIRPLPPLAMSLALQISKKQVICKRDYILSFVVLLRAMGFQARVVYSLVTAPIRPPASELCKITQKKVFDKYKSPKKLGADKRESTTLDELKKGRKEITIKEDPKPNKKKRQKVSNVEKNSEKKGSKRKTDDETLDSRKKKKKETEPKINQLDGANDAGSSSSQSTKSKPNSRSSALKAKQKIQNENAASAKNSTSATTDSPFKKTKGNTSQTSSPVVNTMNHYLPAAKPKLKRLQEVQIETGVDPSPLKTRGQRIQQAKAASVTKNLSSKLDTEPKNTTTKGKPAPNTESGEKLVAPILNKRVSFKENLVSPQPSTSTSKTSNTKPKPALKKHKPIVLSITDDEDDFAEVPIIPRAKPLNKKLAQVKKIDRRVLSTDDEPSPLKPNKKDRIDIWIEVFAEKEKRWITIDLFKGKVDCVGDICNTASSPIAYVLAWNNDNTIKDVSPRYCEHWNTTTRKLRVEKEWWDDTLKPYLGKMNERDKAENRYFDKIHSSKPLPTVISDFKNHPLYALERHLLKFEALYPPDAPPVGWIRGEPVYARDCVYTLHTREKWVKEARVVKLNEEPYKVVKGLKWDRLTNQLIKDVPVEIFGIWQTQPYEPPTAENGIVPRNAYGNVELFKQCMLPKKTVHLQLNGLNKVCKKLQIDCAPAIVGFDFHSGWSHPVYDGFVICEEFQEVATAAWCEDQDEQYRKDQEKIEKRVYGNWKRLIKGLLIRRRLQAKYNFDGDDEDMEEENETKSSDGNSEVKEKPSKVTKKNAPKKK